MGIAHTFKSDETKIFLILSDIPDKNLFFPFLFDTSKKSSPFSLDGSYKKFVTLEKSLSFGDV
ncbi:hypothetical protein, partial [uncultured Dubosiella sp.]|uniref:hypothetical protein n=1 Tax=uncultured Dubosiella sp. TaxID=1937011 RepID=UPI00272FA567